MFILLEGNIFPYQLSEVLLPTEWRHTFSSVHVKGQENECEKNNVGRSNEQSST